MKLSVLTSFSPCTGNKMRSQEVAAYSFSLLQRANDCEVLVFDELNTFEALCNRFSLQRVTGLKTGRDLGVDSRALSMGDMFARAQELAIGNNIMFVNGDNIFVDQNAAARLELLYEYTSGDYACFGRRLEMTEVDRDSRLSSVRTVEEQYALMIRDFTALPRIPYGVDVYAWSRRNFDKMKLLPVLIDGWHYDNWLVNEAYALTCNVYYLSDAIDTVHCYHSDSAHRQSTGTGRPSTVHNARVIAAAYPGVDTLKMNTPLRLLKDIYL